MTFDENKLYFVDGIALQYIVRVMEALYQDRPLTGDERRDLANGLNAHLTQHVEPWQSPNETRQSPRTPGGAGGSDS